jgi:hypothetical protein
MNRPKKFGGDRYQPKQLGAEPAVAAPTVEPEPPAATPAPYAPSPEGQQARASGRKSKSVMDAATLAALRDVKVPFSSRIALTADRQLKELAKEGHTQVDLLAEALNLLFQKYGLDRIE